MTSESSDPVIAPLVELISRIKKVAAAMIALGAAPPLLDLVLGVGAPWPNGAGVAYLTTVVIWIVLLIVHGSAVQSRQSDRRLQMLMIYSGITAVIFLLVYLVGWARVVQTQTTTGSRIVCGLQLLPNTIKLIERLPELTEFKILAANEWQPELVYTAGSLAAARVWIVVSWLGFFGALAATTALYISLFERIAARSVKSKAGHQFEQKKQSQATPE